MGVRCVCVGGCVWGEGRVDAGVGWYTGKDGDGEGCRPDTFVFRPAPASSGQLRLAPATSNPRGGSG